MIGSGSRCRNMRFVRTVVVAAALLATACSVQSAKTQAFKDLGRLDADLVRGVSTRADVLTLLGSPDGRGGWLYGTDSEPAGGPRDIWYYTKFDASYPGGGSQRQLSVFFRGNLYDGYFWFEDTLSIHMF